MAFLTALGAEVVLLDGHLGAVPDGVSLAADKAVLLLGVLLLDGDFGGNGRGGFNRSRHFCLFVCLFFSWGEVLGCVQS